MSKKMIFVLFSILFGLTGCSGETYTKVTREEAMDICNELLPEAGEVLGLYYSGLQWDETLDINFPAESAQEQFSPVISEEYKSIADIKEKTESVFTPEFAEENFYFYFEESEDEDDNFTRPLYKEIDGVLNISINFGGKGWGTEWRTSTLEITEQKENKLVLKMETITHDAPMEYDTLTLRKIDGVWLLDSSIV